MIKILLSSIICIIYRITGGNGNPCLNVRKYLQYIKYWLPHIFFRPIIVIRQQVIIVDIVYLRANESLKGNYYAKARYRLTIKAKIIKPPYPQVQDIT